MRGSLTCKILEKNLLSGIVFTGSELTLRLHQTLTQEATGSMVYLQMGNIIGNDRVKTECSVAYVDHSSLQQGFENADDHEFIKSAAAKYGVIYSKPGGGISHQIHLERFAVPGKILIGSDRHTPTCGGIGMLAIGTGGLEVALGMVKGTYDLIVPKIMNIHLEGSLKSWVSAKDAILYILKLLTVTGGIGYIIEYSGPGVDTLNVTERATMTNMGAELGAITSIFPSDNITLDFLRRHGRAEDYTALYADSDAQYDKTIKINLSGIVPLAAAPDRPDNVVTLASLYGKKVDQVVIGSCSNSSYEDMMKVAKIFEGKRVHSDVSVLISPGSSSVLNMLAQNGALASMIKAGARILESSCGPSIGMAQATKFRGITLRTFNRNFRGQSGTQDAEVYLVSPEAAAVSAIAGYIKDPSVFGSAPEISMPEMFESVDAYFVYPPEDVSNCKINMGPNIKTVPDARSLETRIQAVISLVIGDHITTDTFIPSDATLHPLSSNIQELSKHCFKDFDPEFPKRAIFLGSSVIVCGENYGQGSSHEHSALIPLFLGVKAVVAKSFSKSQNVNLINAGILPLEFVHKSDFDKCTLYDQLVLEKVSESIKSSTWIIHNISKNEFYEVNLLPSQREITILEKGGCINYCTSSATQ